LLPQFRLIDAASDLQSLEWSVIAMYS
jgi:hypothetical protein